MNPCELVTLVSTLSCIISENFDDDELALIAALFTQLGDSIASLLSARIFFNNSDSNSKTNINNLN